MVTSTVPTEAWAVPIPLTDFSGLPVFPPETLPPWIRDHVKAHSVALQTPPDLMAMLDLGAVAAAVAGKAFVLVKPGWQEPLNLYSVVALAPGLKKSPAFKEAIRPIQEFQQTHNEEPGWKAAKLQRDQQRRLWTKARDYHESKAVEADDDGTRAFHEEEALKAATLLAQYPPLFDLQLIADDSTPEGLGQVLARNRERIAVFSSEGGVFEMMAGRYSRGVANLDLWLKGWSGDPVTVNRVSREKIDLYHPLITMGLTVQVAVIEGFADHQEFAGRGLLARYLYSFPQTNVGWRDVQATPAPEIVNAIYRAELSALLVLDPKAPVGVGLTPEARERFIAFHQQVEERLRPGGVLGDSDQIVDWGNKLAGSVARIAGVLHCATTVIDLPIPLATMEAAIGIGEYLIPHARAAFRWVGADPRLSRAKRVLAYLAQHEKLLCSEADLYRDLRGAVFSKPEALKPVMALLEGHGWIRRKLVLAKATGRPPASIWEVHPQALVKGV